MHVRLAIALRSAGFVLLAALACVPTMADERGYLRLATQEIILISAVDETRTRQIATHIETFRAAVEQAFGVRLSAYMPTRIHALSREDWVRYAQPRPGVAGYFLTNPFSSDLLFDAEDETSGTYELMLHEYTHYILRTFFPGEIPPFLDEGLAEVFSTATFHDGVVRLQPRPDHVRRLRRSDWLPFERLLEVGRDDPEYVDHTLAPVFYAQAWATLYYVIATDTDFGRHVMRYVRDVESGGPRLRAAERLIGHPGAQVNGKIAEFILRRQRLPVTLIRVAQPVQAGRQDLRRLGPDERALMLGELLLRYGNRNRQALQLFEQVSGSSPGNARARIGAAWAHLQDGERGQAAALLEAIEDPSQLDAATAVALGRGLFQLVAAATREPAQQTGSKPDDELQRRRLVRARALFEGALSDESCWLEAVNGFVLASLALDEWDTSLIELARRAFRAAPKSSELAVGLAILHELEGRNDLARTYWLEAARHARAGQVRARILSALEGSR